MDGRLHRSVVGRYEHNHPGDLVHVDVKKLGKVPPGGGWRVHGREVVRGQHHRTRVGYCFVHSAVDDHSRLAYSEIHDDEQALTAVGGLGVRLDRRQPDIPELLDEFDQRRQALRPGPVEATCPFATLCEKPALP